jgi:hypothetical protein
MQDAPNRNQAPLFSPLLFRQDGKEGAAGGNRQLQICDNLSVSAAPSQLPWKGSLGVMLDNFGIIITKEPKGIIDHI